MSAIVIREVKAKNNQFAYEVDFYMNGTHGNADPTETRRTDNYPIKQNAFVEACQIKNEFQKANS